MGLFGMINRMENRMERQIERDINRAERRQNFEMPCAPAGSWQQSARNIQVTGAPGRHMVSAELKDATGFWRSACTQFQAGDRFENDNGQFRLARCPAGRGHAHPNPPAGSWRQTARPGSIRVNPAPKDRKAKIVLAGSCYNSLRIRVGPSLSHNVTNGINILKPGDVITCLECSSDGKWMRHERGWSRVFDPVGKVWNIQYLEPPSLGDGWVLHAELKAANGCYCQARTHFHPRRPHEHFENCNGQFRKVHHNGRC